MLPGRLRYTIYILTIRHTETLSIFGLVGFPYEAFPTNALRG